tara:strand:+ start:165 stop:335 length:171 start_codon:yes stop_codon:yes gene_type:complete
LTETQVTVILTLLTGRTNLTGRMSMVITHMNKLDETKQAQQENDKSFDHKKPPPAV